MRETMAPEPKTLEWLKTSGGLHNNAFYLTFDGDLSGIPEEIFSEFLRLPADAGKRIFDVICASGNLLKQVPQDLLDRGILTTQTTPETRSPLQTAAASSALDLLPWDSFSPIRWLPHLEQLRLARITRGSALTTPAFEAFINKVETIQRAFIKLAERTQRLKALEPVDSQEGAVT